ncbi:hypothetical protein GGI15_002806 [Coemansia interrupta]|uniref:UPF3 domain-containing protein n=1 Tax=Coemansia interrupta TaxID=1126814 RepID=A0A9W8LJN4_9FUNG|nr:hypothetical protein GGI15_002806 [Coemansia interrupta]
MDEQKPHPQASKPAVDQDGTAAKPARRRRTRSTVPAQASSTQAPASGSTKPPQQQQQQQQPKKKKPRSQDAPGAQPKGKQKPAPASSAAGRSDQPAAAAATATAAAAGQTESGGTSRRKARGGSSATAPAAAEKGKPKKAERAPKPKPDAKQPAGDTKKNGGKNGSRAASKAQSQVPSRAPSPSTQQGGRADKPRTPKKEKKAGGPKNEPAAREPRSKGAEAGRSVETPAEPADQQAGGQPESFDRTKPMTKVCVRWLPADLPEHVFWKSIEPALPWHDPSVQGTVEQKHVQQAVAQPAAEAKTEGDAEDGVQMPETTVLEMHAPTVAVAVDVYRSPAVDLLDQAPYWRQYVAGKQHRTRGKPDDPSRAYICFATPAEVEHFYQRYHGHVFAKNGAVSRAVVELAPWQQVGRDSGVDVLAGTLAEDAEFLGFLRKCTGGGAEEEEPAAAERRPVEVRISYAAAAKTVAAAGAAVGAAEDGAVRSTPLIEYLRSIKKRPAAGAKAGARAGAKAPAKAAAKVAAKAEAKGAGSASQQQQQQQQKTASASAKRRRRRDR